jgi:hypothetical protein
MIIYLSFKTINKNEKTDYCIFDASLFNCPISPTQIRQFL